MNIYINSDTALIQSGLTDALTNLPVEDATVTAEFGTKADPDTVLASVVMQHATSGEYVGVLTHDALSPEEGDEFEVRIRSEKQGRRIVKYVDAKAKKAGPND